MICDRCQGKPVVRILTRRVEGRSLPVYLCRACSSTAAAREGSGTALERPCPRCGEREGTVKLTRLRDGVRTVSFLCEACAAAKGGDRR